jgi:hypothetical protein
MRELAVRFKIHRTTVSDHLRRQGVDARVQGLTEEQAVMAAGLYSQGWSLARLGVRFGVDGMTIRGALLQLGVKMRRPHERRQASDSAQGSPDRRLSTSPNGGGSDALLSVLPERPSTYPPTQAQTPLTQ